jgi:hypothetical protein
MILASIQIPSKDLICEKTVSSSILAEFPLQRRNCTKQRNFFETENVETGQKLDQLQMNFNASFTTVSPQLCSL